MLKEKLEERVTERKDSKENLITLVKYKGFEIKTGSHILSKIYAIVHLVFMLPGIVVHELGHGIGQLQGRSVQAVFWSGPGLALAVGILFMMPPLTLSVGGTAVAISGWIAATCILAGTVNGLHDWFYWKGYSDEEIEEVKEEMGLNG